MTKLSTFVFSMAVALAGAACKKEDKPADGGKQPVAEQPVKPEPGAGSGSGSGSGTGSGTAAVVDPGAGAASGTAAPAAGDTLTVVVRAPAVGLKFTATDSLDMNAKLTAGDKNVDMVQARTETTHQEVLAAADNVVTKKKVHYEARSQKQTIGPQAKDEPQPLLGKTFVMTFANGAMTAVRLDADQEVPLSPEELAALQDDQKDFGKVPGIVQVLAKQSWKKGEQVPLSAESLALMNTEFGDNGENEVKGGTMTFLGAAGDVATCRLTLDMTAKGGVAMTMDAEFSFDTARTLLLDMKMTGTMKGTSQSPQGPVSIDGTMRGRNSNTYQ